MATTTRSVTLSCLQALGVSRALAAVEHEGRWEGRIERELCIPVASALPQRTFEHHLGYRTARQMLPDKDTIGCQQMTLCQGRKGYLCQIRSVGGIEKQYIRLQRSRQLLQRLR